MNVDTAALSGSGGGIASFGSGTGSRAAGTRSAGRGGRKKAPARSVRHHQGAARAIQADTGASPRARRQAGQIARTLTNSRQTNADANRARVALAALRAQRGSPSAGRIR